MAPVLQHIIRKPRKIKLNLMWKRKNLKPNFKDTSWTQAWEIPKIMTLILESIRQNLHLVTTDRIVCTIIPSVRRSQFSQKIKDIKKRSSWIVRIKLRLSFREQMYLQWKAQNNRRNLTKITRKESVAPHPVWMPSRPPEVQVKTKAIATYPAKDQSWKIS